ncbi:MAG: hypothetical protein ABIT05_01400 [Chitinophagaceae bacterium]
MEKEVKQTLEQVADTVLENTVTFEIIILPQTPVHRWLQKVGWIPAKKNFVIKPIVLGSLLKISDLLLSIDLEQLQKGKGYLETSYHLVSRHTDTMVRVIAIAIQNTRQEPSGSLMSLLRNNLSSKELMTLLSLVLKQMDLQNFIASIISIRGLNVLESAVTKNESSEVSPSQQGS